MVGDNPERLKQSLQLALARSDVIILTGGLGPTQDDITKETVSGVLGRKLVLDQESLGNMEDFFTRRNRKMTQNNLKQAFFPEGCTIVRNSAGTAPGCIIEDRGRIIVMLPGPPSEMKPMFEEMVMPFLESKSEHRLESVYVRVFGIGESSVEDALLDLIDGQTNPTIASYARDGEVTLRITASYPKDRPGCDLISPVVEEIKRRFGAAVFSIDNSSLDEAAARLLIEKKKTISLAGPRESLLAARLTDIPVFQRFLTGRLAYSNRARWNILASGRKRSTFGAVSEQTTSEMAVGIRNISGSDIEYSHRITATGGLLKAVGLVYTALATWAE